MMDIALDKEKDFETPLGLIAYKHVRVPQVPFDAAGDLTTTQTVAVPQDTQFVHIAVTAVDVCFGSVQQTESRYFSSLIFQAMVDDLSAPTLKYTVRAQLISEDPRDHWNGTIWLTILCFGKCPVPKPECVAK